MRILPGEDPMEKLRRVASAKGIPVPPEPEVAKRLRHNLWRSLSGREQTGPWGVKELGARNPIREYQSLKEAKQHNMRNRSLYIVNAQTNEALAPVVFEGNWYWWSLSHGNWQDLEGRPCGSGVSPLL